MSTEVKREVTIERVNGEKVLVDGDDQVKTKTTTKVTCDGPRCATHHGADDPVSLTWNDEDVAADANAMPDDAARLIRMQFGMFAEKLFEFCGPSCVKDYLAYSYVEPRSPREKTLQESLKV